MMPLARLVLELKAPALILTINRLRLRTTIGVYDWEKSRPRDVIVTVRMRFDGARAITSDNIADTIDYDSLASKLQHDVEPLHYYLIEKLTARILELVMEDEKVTWAEVIVEKSGVPALADSVSVKAERSRG